MKESDNGNWTMHLTLLATQPSAERTLSPNTIIDF